MSEAMNVGTVVAHLVFDDSGVDKGTRSATQKIQQFAKTGSAEGAKAGKAIGDAAGTGTVDAFGKSEGKLTAKTKSMFSSVAGVATGILGGIGVAQILTKGWDRLTGIENAQAKIKGLGHDAAETTTIMDNALASVKGTAFGMAEAATTAAGAVAAGIKPGQDLEGVLKAVANSAAAAGVGMDVMGGIFNKVASIGKAQNDVLQQVANMGLPIYQKLADQLGVTTDKVFDLASQGKISFAQFESAMKSAAGTVADEMGQTTTGALANMGAAVSRFGATLLEDVMPLAKDAFTTITAGLDAVSKPLGAVISGFAALPGPVKAGAAALAAFKIAETTGLFSKLADSVTLARVRFAELGGGMAGIRGAGSGLFDMMGGPWGLAIAGATAGFTLLAKGIADSNKPLVDSTQLIDENTGALQKNAQATVAKSLADKGYLDLANKVGLAGGVLSDAFLGDAQAAAEVTTKVKAYLSTGEAAVRQGPKGIIAVAGASKDAQRDVGAFYDLLHDMGVQSDDLADAQHHAAQALAEANGATKEQLEALGANREAAVKTADAWRNYGLSINSAVKMQDDAKSGLSDLKLAWTEQSDANRDAKSAAAEWAAQWAALPDTVGGMTSALSDFSDQTSVADTRLQFFTMSVDALAGRDVSLEDATKLLNDQVRNLKDGFADATKATKGHAEALINADGSINTVTEAGSKLYDAVSDYRKAYDQATNAARDHALATGTNADALKAAQKAADGARAKFLEQAAALKINKTDAEKLADSMGILEGKKLTAKTLGIYVDDQATSKIEQINALKLDDKSFTAWVTMATKDEQLHGGGRDSRHATGGLISGPGSGTSDSILARLSNGEYVINAESAAKHRGLLDIINSSPGFASGGIEGPTSQQLSGLPAVTVGPILTAVQSALAQFADTAAQTADALTDAKEKAADARDTETQLTDAYRDQAAENRNRVAEVTAQRDKAVADAKGRLAEEQARFAKAKAGSKEAATAAAAVSKAQQAVTKAEADRTSTIKKTTAAIEKSQAADLKKLQSAQAATKAAEADAAAAKARAGAVAALQQQSQFLQRTQERLAGQLDDTNTALDAATASLSNLQQESQQLHDSVAGKITGDASITGLNPGSTVQNIIDYLTTQSSQSSALSGSLSALAKMGLNGQVLQDIAGMGLSGGALASTLAGASAAQIGQINSLQAQIAAAADRSGKSVADAIYANDINLWQQQVNYLDERQADLEAALKANADALADAITKALTLQTDRTVAQVQAVSADVKAGTDEIKSMPTKLVTAIRKAG